MLKSLNKRSLQVISVGCPGVASSLNRSGNDSMIDFSAYHEHMQKKPFVHPSFWLPGAAMTGVFASKPNKSMLNQATSIGISSVSSVRYVHTDLKAPDMDAYRSEESLDPHSSKRDNRERVKSMAGAVAGASLMLGCMCVKGIIHPVVQQWTASADVMALAQIEINKEDVAPGTGKTFKWRGKPLFVRRRTEAEIEAAQNVDVKTLKDPENDADRTKDPEWLVVLGVCTHLGCVPISHAGAYNGYYCPCHGSHYDTSGRIRQGPAPLNLEVPQYVFEDDKLVVG